MWWKPTVSMRAVLFMVRRTGCWPYEEIMWLRQFWARFPAHVSLLPSFAPIASNIWTYKCEYIISIQWMACDVHAESKAYTFVLAQYLVRGAHMIPIFDGPPTTKSSCYFNNLINIDMDVFIRAGNCD